MEVITHKRCTKCMTLKSVREFHCDGTAVDGYKTQCKACKCEKAKERDRARREAGIKRDRTPKKPEPLWPMPTHTLTEGLACVRMRAWRGPVNPGQMVATL